MQNKPKLLSEVKRKKEESMKQKKNYIFILVFSALCLALSLTIKSLSIFVPIGIPILKIGFNGPPLRVIAIIFGPLYGGIVSGLSDFLGFFLMDKSGNFYLYQLTVTAVLNSVCIGYLWRFFRSKSGKVVKFSYLAAISALLIYGCVSFFLTYGREDALKQMQGSVVIIVAALVGLILYFVNYFITKKQAKEAFGQYFFQMFLSITIPSILFNWVNTYILIDIFFKNKQKDMFLFGLLRSAVQLLECYYNTVLVLFIVILLSPLFAKKGIYLFGQGRSNKDMEKQS